MITREKVVIGNVYYHFQHWTPDTPVGDVYEITASRLEYTVGGKIKRVVFTTADGSEVSPWLREVYAKRKLAEFHMQNSRDLLETPW